MRELDLIRHISTLAQNRDPRVIRGIGDDCAVLRSEVGDDLLVTADMLVEGVHFDLSWHDPYRLGRKAIAVNLSDIAAMGGTPRFAMLCLALPARLSSKWVVEIMEGMHSRLRNSNCSLVGGDTVASSQLSISVTVIGSVPADGAILRSGARPGDTVYVSGQLGSAAAGFRLCQAGLCKEEDKQDDLHTPFVNNHLDPEPRVKLGDILRRSGMVSAMQDISDGIATDLCHICTGSGVGAEIEEEALPGHPLLSSLCDRYGWRMSELQIGGGEDYELLFTVKEGAGQDLERFVANQQGGKLYRIGRIIDGSGVMMRSVDGMLTEVSYQGYQHL